MPNTITTSAYAKINFTLDVLGSRPDGYHETRSVMQTIALSDRLTIQQTPHTLGVRLDVTGDEAAGVPADGSNLVHRAAARLCRGHGLHIHLEKSIPSQAGLGGGSSDAAATLLAVNQLLEIGLSRAQLTELGAELGADVPFFLTGGTALVEGIGERVTALPPSDPWHLVIIRPNVGVSTAWAYRALDNIANRVPGDATSAWENEASPTLSNDFEQVILPAVLEIAHAYAAMQDANGQSPLLCGSGSAVFCRVDSQSAAELLVARLTEARAGKIWVTQTINAGAQI